MRVRVCVRMRVCVREGVGMGVAVGMGMTSAVQRVSSGAAKHRTHPQPHAAHTAAAGHIGAKQSACRTAGHAAHATAPATAQLQARGARLVGGHRDCCRCTIVSGRRHSRCSCIGAHRGRKDGAAGRMGAARGARRGGQVDAR